MIKINLARNRVGSETQVAGTSASSIGLPALGGGSSTEARESLVKLGFIVLSTVGLMIYESRSIQELNRQMAQSKAQIDQLTIEAAAKKAEAEKVKDLESQAKELEDKFKVLTLLSRLRLREVKTLDFMQSAIPEKLWLQKIAYQADKQKIEQGQFQFVGLSVATEDLSEFTKRLDESVYLADVIVIKNKEVQMARGGGSNTNVREFDFSAEVERKN